MWPVRRSPVPRAEESPESALRAAKAPPGRNLLDVANFHLKTGNHTDAEKLLCSIGLDHPDATQAINLLMRSYCESGRMDEAKALLYSATSKKLADPGTYHMAITSFLGQNDYEAAKSSLAMAVQNNLADDAMLLELTGYCRMTSRIQDALDILCDAEQKQVLSPALAKESRTLQRLLPDHTAPKAATPAHGPGDDIVERVLGKTREEASSCNLRISHYLSRGEVDYAYEIFQQTAQRNLVENPLYCRMLQACKESGDAKMGKEVFDVAVRNKRADPGICVLAVSICVQWGKLDAVKEIVAKAEPIYPSIYATVFGKCYSKGRYADILSIISDMPERLQNNPNTILRKMDALRKLRRYDEVISSADSLMERPGLDSEFMHLAKIIKSFALIHTGKAYEAFETLKRVADSIPKNHEDYLRAICGLVFAYNVLEDDRLLSQSERDSILKYLEQQAGTRNPGMNHDIECAMSMLESKS